MEFSSDLIETLRSRSEYSVVVGLCSLLAAVVTAVVLLRRRRGPSTVVVDEIQWEKQSKRNNENKKTKQKKVKATTSAASKNTSNSNLAQVSLKPSPVKNASKEKQTDEKTKPVQKKGPSVNPVSKPVQQMAETSGDWTVAGLKKKQRTKKTDSGVENTKGNAASNIQTIKNPKTEDSKEVEVDLLFDKATPSSVTEEQMCMVDVKNLNDDNGVLFREPNQIDASHKHLVDSSQQPVGVLSPSPKKSDEGSSVQSTEKESKLKKTSKKKKSKLSADITQNAASDSQVGEKTSYSSLISNMDPQTEKGPASSEDVFKDTTPLDVQVEAAGIPKDPSNSSGTDLFKAVSEVSSRSTAPTASSTSADDKASDKKISKAVGSSVPDNCPDVSGINVAEIAVSCAVNDVPSTSGGGTLPSQIVFDELGLKDDALNSSHSALKKKKKARRDV